MNEGFFKKEQIESVIVKKRARLRSTPNCKACKLYRGCNSPKMQATGRGKKKILIIAEAPDKTEDLKGTQLVGADGKLLRDTLDDMGIDLDKDCRKINAINCRPPDNRTPTLKEIDHCRPMVWNEIKSFKPKVIILLGGVALQSFLNHRWHKDLGPITKWRGWQIPDRDVNAWVCPTYHPSFIDRHTTSDVADVIWRQDLQNAIDKRKVPIEYSDEKECVEIVNEKDAIMKMKWLLMSADLGPFNMAFDYETTGIKPHAKGHKIVSCAIAYSTLEGDYAFSFMMTKRTAHSFKELLKHKHIEKIAHNMKFEESWSRVILKTKVKSWVWDTMQASHVLDNRRWISSLKFQTYINFGLMDYDSHIEPFLKSSKNNANSFNRITDINQNELLLYNGMDALLEYRLAMKQMKQLV